MTTNDVISLQQWWIRELNAIRERVIKAEGKRMEREVNRHHDELSDYRNLNDIQDAYSFGCITEKKYDRLRRLWEEREQAGRMSDGSLLKLHLLDELKQTAKNIIEESTKGEESPWEPS